MPPAGCYALFPTKSVHISLQTRRPIFDMMDLKPPELGRGKSRMPAKILVVDDHKAMRIALCDWLAGALPGCEVTAASTGEEAVCLSVEWLPTLIIMDLGLPGISGLEATRRIKAERPRCPVLILTIHEGELYRAEALASGASDYVPKRLMQSALLPTITALLDPSEDTSQRRASLLG